MKTRIIGIAAGTVLAGVAAVATFASSDFVSTQEDPTPTAEATETATATTTPDATQTPTETATPEPTDTAEPDPTATPDGEDDDRHGIPDSNPVFSPDDDDECEKHETREKTTPSGNIVTVPCHAADKELPHDKNKGGPDDEEEDDADDADEIDDDEATDDEDDAEGDD